MKRAENGTKWALLREICPHPSSLLTTIHPHCPPLPLKKIQQILQRNSCLVWEQFAAMARGERDEEEEVEEVREDKVEKGEEEEGIIRFDSTG